MLKNSLTFQFLLNPFSVGAVMPSSPALADEITSSISLEKASFIAELGPGTGALTGSILRKKHSGAHFFAIELNEAVLKSFQKKFPDVKVYHDNAANLKKIAKQGENTDTVDIVISGLPWASFPAGLQETLLQAIFDTLPKGGCFATFTYIHAPFLPAGKRFRRKLGNYFSRIEESSIVWKNFPPAFVYRCIK